MRRWRWYTGLLPLALLAACAGHGGAEEHGEPPPVRASAPLPDGRVHIAEASRRFVTVEPARASADAAALRVPARVAFRDGAMSQVGAPLEGRVLEVRVRTGDAVRPGDPLVVMECPEAARARTSLASALASARAARAALERETRLVAEGAGSLRDRMAAEVQLASAEAELERARAAARFVGAGASATVVLRALIAGTVITRAATVGEAAEPGQVLVELGDPSALWVVGDVFERDLPLVREGAAATVELPSAPAPLRGRVLRVGAVVSAGMRTAPVQVAVEGDESALRPGMYGRLRIASSEARLTLPAEAVLLHEGRATVVYVARDELTFERRAVSVGLPVEGRVQVLGGLAAGEPVVVRGALLLDAAADQLL